MLKNPASVEVADALVGNEPNFESVGLDNGGDVIAEDVDCSNFYFDDVEVNTADDSLDAYDNDDAV